MNSGKPKTVSPVAIYGFFVLGVISAVLFRVILVVERIDPSWVRPVWYMAVVGYMFFFLYRAYIAKKRKRVIEENMLMEKLQANACLTEEDRDLVMYLLGSLKKSLEDVNYGIIFVLSIVAIIVDLILAAYK